MLFTRVAGRIRGRPVNQTAFGLGDVRLGAVIGLSVGIPVVFRALLFAVRLGDLAAALYWFVRAVAGRRYAPFPTVPLAPFLVAGALLTLYLGLAIPSRSLGTL